MDLIYIILISIAVVSFITGSIIRAVQKKYGIVEAVNGLENSGNPELSNLEKTLNPENTLSVNIDSNNKAVTFDEPVIVSSVVLDSYDDEIL
ncbi:MAG: hypothetical protein IJI22_05860 [Bacilli bacterium]|nr:hypothetical protein [Bacilli bacterium]